MLNGSIVAVQRSYRNFFNDGRSPDKKFIKAMVSKFKETGPTVDKRRCGRPRTVRTEVSILKFNKQPLGAARMSQG